MIFPSFDVWLIKSGDVAMIFQLRLYGPRRSATAHLLKSVLVRFLLV